MILSTIETVVGALSTPCAFFYANLYEANGTLGVPAFSEGKDVFFVYIPPLENTDTYGENGLIHTKFPLQFFLMKKLELPTEDYKSADVDPIIDEMRELAREFIHRLDSENIVEKGGGMEDGPEGITETRINSEYAWLDHHLFGVSVTCEVPIMEGKTGCR